jgi:hypothetical protein
MTNTELAIQNLLKQNPIEIADIDEWAAKLRRLGYSFLNPVDGRAQMQLKKYGRTYHLIVADNERRQLGGIPQPCFMGNNGFALRKITKY